MRVMFGEKTLESELHMAHVTVEAAGDDLTVSLVNPWGVIAEWSLDTDTLAALVMQRGQLNMGHPSAIHHAAVARKMSEL